jgi:hypothetical protein
VSGESHRRAPKRLDRRTAIKWMLSASSALMVSGGALAQPTRPAKNTAPRAAGPATPIPPLPKGTGYGTDPDLMKAYSAGDYWPLTLSEEQRRTVTVLADDILPADERSPSASAVGVPEFIDEWISAPYPSHRDDRVRVLEGLRWLDEEALRRFGRRFDALEEAQRHAILGAICRPAAATPEFVEPAHFFNRFRELVLGGFYTTPEGMRDIGYVGNLPSQSFDGPPQAVLTRLGLDGHVPG